MSAELVRPFAESLGATSELVATDPVRLRMGGAP
jgi:hypothetical protein